MKSHFMGIPRKDGSVGIRNFFLVIAVDECCEGLAKQIAKSDPEGVALTNYTTCMLGGNEELYQQMVCTAKNPNVAGCLIVEMGCGSFPIAQMAEEIASSQKPVRTLCCIDNGGTRASIDKGCALLRELREECGPCQRVPVPIRELIVGVKCGGSDTISGLASNPVIGSMVDKLVDMGATAIGGELMELVGCEEALIQRAITPEVGEKICRLIREEERRWNIDGVGAESMSVGNSLGGLTTIEEKALGALHKMGTQPIQDILQIDHTRIDHPKAHGFYLSEATMLCGGSALHFLSMGAHMVVWSTAGAGFNNRLIPVIRVSGNPARITEDVDMDATGVLSGTHSIDEIGARLLDYVVDVASGKETALEWCAESSMTMIQKDQKLESFLSKSCTCSM